MRSRSHKGHSFRKCHRHYLKPYHYLNLQPKFEVNPTSSFRVKAHNSKLGQGYTQGHTKVTLSENVADIMVNLHTKFEGNPTSSFQVMAYGMQIGTFF